MRGNLWRRLERLEAAYGDDGMRQLGRWAEGFPQDTERILRAVKGRESLILPHLVEDGITWQGFLLLYEWLQRVPEDHSQSNRPEPIRQ